MWGGGGPGAEAKAEVTSTEGRDLLSSLTEMLVMGGGCSCDMVDGYLFVVGRNGAFTEACHVTKCVRFIESGGEGVSA